MANPRKELGVDQRCGGVERESILGLAHAGIGLEGNLAQSAEYRRSPASPQFIPEPVAKFGCDYGENDDCGQAHVAQTGHGAGGDHHGREQQGQADPLQQGE